MQEVHDLQMSLELQRESDTREDSIENTLSTGVKKANRARRTDRTNRIEECIDQAGDIRTRIDGIEKELSLRTTTPAVEPSSTFQASPVHFDLARVVSLDQIMDKLSEVSEKFSSLLRSQISDVNVSITSLQVATHIRVGAAELRMGHMEQTALVDRSAIRENGTRISELKDLISEQTVALERLRQLDDTSRIDELQAQVEEQLRRAVGNEEKSREFDAWAVREQATREKSLAEHETRIAAVERLAVTLKSPKASRLEQREEWGPEDVDYNQPPSTAIPQFAFPSSTPAMSSPTPPAIAQYAFASSSSRIQASPIVDDRKSLQFGLVQTVIKAQSEGSAVCVPLDGPAGHGDPTFFEPSYVSRVRDTRRVPPKRPSGDGPGEGDSDDDDEGSRDRHRGSLNRSGNRGRPHRNDEPPFDVILLKGLLYLTTEQYYSGFDGRCFPKGLKFEPLMPKAAWARSPIQVTPTVATEAVRFIELTEAQVRHRNLYCYLQNEEQFTSGVVNSLTGPAGDWAAKELLANPQFGLDYAVFLDRFACAYLPINSAIEKSRSLQFTDPSALKAKSLSLDSIKTFLAEVAVTEVTLKALVRFYPEDAGKFARPSDADMITLVWNCLSSALRYNTRMEIAQEYPLVKFDKTPWLVFIVTLNSEIAKLVLAESRRPIATPSAPAILPWRRPAASIHALDSELCVDEDCLAIDAIYLAVVDSVHELGGYTDFATGMIGQDEAEELRDICRDAYNDDIVLQSALCDEHGKIFAMMGERGDVVPLRNCWRCGKDHLVRDCPVPAVPGNEYPLRPPRSTSALSSSKGSKGGKGGGSANPSSGFSKPGYPRNI